MGAGLLHLHNALRWVILIAGVIAIVKAILNASSGKPYQKGAGTVFVASLHVQLILGFVIWAGVSGLVATFRADPGAAMKITALRFFGVEHTVFMLAAVVVATIGGARARRGADDATRNKTARTFFLIAMVLLLLGIPWPFRGDGVGRGLFPGMSAPAATTTTDAPTDPARIAPPQPTVG
jgi:hypothetical protein